MSNLLEQKLKGKRLILASKSPRRQSLLGGLDIPFIVQTKEVEEHWPPALQGAEVPRYLSRLKAAAFKDELAPDDLLITCDTTVHLDNEVLEKAATPDEARQMLQKLSGKCHTVITAFTLLTKDYDHTEHCETRVCFRELRVEEIEYYVEKYQPFDKAGAYGIQEYIGFIGAARLEGSYFNVMGLPLHQIYEALLKIPE